MSEYGGLHASISHQISVIQHRTADPQTSTVSIASAADRAASGRVNPKVSAAKVASEFPLIRVRRFW